MCKIGHCGKSYTLTSQTFGCQVDSRVVIYDRRAFNILTTVPVLIGRSDSNPGQHNDKTTSITTWPFGHGTNFPQFFLYIQ